MRQNILSKTYKELTIDKMLYYFSDEKNLDRLLNAVQILKEIYSKDPTKMKKIYKEKYTAKIQNLISKKEHGVRDQLRSRNIPFVQIQLVPKTRVIYGSTTNPDLIKMDYERVKIRTERQLEKDKKDKLFLDMKIGKEIEIFWDKEKGFIGIEVVGDNYFLARESDNFLVILKDSTYKIIPIDSKTFIGTNVVYINKYNSNRTFSIIYTDIETKISYAKKFKIEKFIIDKVYNIGLSDNRVVRYISFDPEDKVVVHYKKKSRQKINEEIFDFSQLEFNDILEKDTQISKKEISKVVKRK